MSPSPPYLNKELFSKRFLDHLLRQRPEWQETEEATQARDKLRALYAKEKASLSRLKEQQLEQRFIRPVLEALSIVYDVQPVLPTDDPRVKLAPDYTFFATEEDRLSAQALPENEKASSYFKKVRMIGDAKRWGTEFGGAARGEKTPRQQLTQYLHLSGVDWGFLTDGRNWRLVHRTVAGRLDHYYQVDLCASLDSEDLDDFRYFYLFFRGEAIRPGKTGELCFLDSARKESLEYAESVGRELKGAVYDALSLLAKAFLCRIERGQTPPPENLLGRECLVLLYRLLFLFYAEHRGLLPLDDPRYRENYSLTGLSRVLAEKRDAGIILSSHAASLWGRLNGLFEMIDRGDPDLRVPAYNGGLFSAKEHPFLAEKKPGDRDLAAVIDLLARTPMRSAEKHFIDYRDLSIRHLGTIYEGLLEYHLKIAETDLAIVKNGKDQRERYEPLDPVRHADLPSDSRIPKGEPYLLTDSGERWVTGSYYTPDFIVEYIVEETLGPLVLDRRPKDVLGLRVLDPAMGSGHFLLEAVDFLARAYGQARIDAREDDDDDDGILSDTELSEYRRLVVEHCIYGVDKNPMAVELAKLALWLKTMARDRPLTFLDNHLKWGNSLLSARVDQIGAEQNGRSKRNGPARSAQVTLFEHAFLSKLPTMLAQVLQIVGRETRNREDIDMKEEWDAAVEDIRRPFSAVADVHVSRLGKPPDHQLEKLLMLLHRPQELMSHPEVVEIQDLWARWPCLHFELVFPEVFYNEHGRRRDDAGFDAVIGNPPWIRQETISADKAKLAALYPEVFHSVADIYVFFLCAGLKLLHDHGRLGMLVPNKWQRADYGQALRRFLTERHHPVSLTDFGHAPIFPDADTFPCILVLQAEKPADKDEGLLFCQVPKEALEGIKLSIFVRNEGYRVSRDQLREEGWHPQPPDIARLMKKIRNASVPLMEYLGSRPVWGLKTGFNEAFLVDHIARDCLIGKDPSCANIIKKFHRGRDIDRWRARWGGEWMIALSSSDNKLWPWAEKGDLAEKVFQSTYPSLYKHMKIHEGPLRKRQDHGRYWWELRPSDAYSMLEAPKIIYPQIQFHSCFALDQDGYYLLDTMFLLPTGDLGLLTVLNSSLMWWYLWLTAPHKKDEAFALHAFYMETLPIVAAPKDGAEELVRLTAERQQEEEAFLSWLRVEMELPKISQKLESFWRLNEADFLKEIKKTGIHIGKSALSRLREEFEKTRDRILPLVVRAKEVELAQHAVVEKLYGLTARDVDLLRTTAPPRDPLALISAGQSRTGLV